MNFIFDKDIILENDAVQLRPILLTDFEYLKPLAIGDKKLLEYSPKPIYTEPLLLNFIKEAILNRENQTRYTFIAYCKKTQAYAGCTSFMNISNHDDKLEIGGTWFGRTFHRSGVNRNCKYLMLEYAFDRLLAERIEFKTDERNIVSRKAIEAIGGKMEGIFRHHMLLSDGHRRNTVYYSILREEWPDLKVKLLK